MTQVFLQLVAASFGFTTDCWCPCHSIACECLITMEILHLREVTSENMSVIPSSHSTVTYLFTLNEKQDFVLTVYFFFVEDYFPEVSGESHAHRKLRNANYNECWNSIKKEIEVRVDFPFVLNALAPHLNSTHLELYSLYHM